VTLRADQDTVHYVTRGINLKSVASTTIVPSTRTSRRFIVNRIYVIIASGSGFTGSPTIRVSSVGNGGSAGDIVAASSLGNTNFQGCNQLSLASTLTAWSLAAGTGSINLDVTVAATATTATADVHVLGYFI